VSRPSMRARMKTTIFTAGIRTIPKTSSSYFKVKLKILNAFLICWGSKNQPKTKPSKEKEGVKCEGYQLKRLNQTNKEQTFKSVWQKKTLSSLQSLLNHVWVKLLDPKTRMNLSLGGYVSYLLMRHPMVGSKNCSKTHMSSMRLRQMNCKAMF